MAENQPAEQPQRTGALAKRPVIGYLAPGIHDESQSQWLGVVDAAQEQDVNLLCFPGATLRLAPDAPEPANILYELAGAANVDGLVSWASSVGNLISPDANRTFHAHYQTLPLVTIGQAWEGIPGLLMESYQVCMRR
jgi:hypothetical protein